MSILEQRKDRYLRAPRFQPGSETPILEVIAWENDRERILAFHLAEDGSPIREEPLTELLPSISGYSSEPGTPGVGALAELEARHGGSRAFIEQRHGESCIYLERDGETHLVQRAPAMFAAPAVFETPDGAYVAFHHDLREDRGVRDIAKWIAIRFVDRSGNVFEPSAPMLELDRDREGVEQSFEFPALVVGADGAVALFGRGSHNFYRQDWSADGFGPRLPLSDGEWGSRGRRVAAAVFGDRLFIARRDRKGIVIDVQEAPRGGAPALRKAATELGPPPPIPTWERERDPASARGLRSFFGDIQQHSAHSDGVGSAEEAYLRARDIYGDDFVALTDHEAFLGKRTGPGEWEYLKDVADRFNDAGRFATLIAYEWTGRAYPGPGHKCVYFPHRDFPILSRDDLPEGRQLVQAIRELGGIASPHHIGWTGCDEEGHDPIGQPVWEICSCHGCYEHPNHPLGQRGEHHHQLVDAMLAKGHRFGFTASSDSHGLLYHHGEARKRDPYRTGLTAILAKELTREAIFDALKSRSCYATSGAKIRLDFTGDGHPMGSEFESKGVPVRFLGRAVGERALRAVQLIGPQAKVLAEGEVSGDEGSLDVSIWAPYAYLRVIQEDGEMAWASPIFTTSPERRPGD